MQHTEHGHKCSNTRQSYHCVSSPGGLLCPPDPAVTPDSLLTSSKAPHITDGCLGRRHLIEKAARWVQIPAPVFLAEAFRAMGTPLCGCSLVCKTRMMTPVLITQQ